jgi:hypothetical protein
MGDMSRMSRSVLFVEEFKDLGEAISAKRGHEISIALSDEDYSVREYVSIDGFSYMGVSSVYNPDDDYDEIESTAEWMAVVMERPCEEILARFEKAGLYEKKVTS